MSTVKVFKVSPHEERIKPLSISRRNQARLFEAHVSDPARPRPDRRQPSSKSYLEREERRGEETRQSALTKAPRQLRWRATLGRRARGGAARRSGGNGSGSRVACRPCWWPRRGSRPSGCMQEYSSFETVRKQYEVSGFFPCLSGAAWIEQSDRFSSFSPQTCSRSQEVSRWAERSVCPSLRPWRREA
ncbi:hypothetical protein EYF80_049044 [Liparis tanakae]|uniref:Uncharacterized protein n=1 Tax=Liparis tanakae TaxID=230148 RepID=A0A4Z2FIJ5_9TELE|nr:hypothetical protein EYF80_049044 [Liparis tanakae]